MARSIQLYRVATALLLVLSSWLSIGLANAADTVTYYHTDALGTPVMESNATGQVTYAREHRPYGEQALGAVKNGPGFAGHISDADTELTYMQARYYDPAAGRFLSKDPIAPDLRSGQNFNRYWYANGNPYRFVDPDGQEIKTTLPDILHQDGPKCQLDPYCAYQLSDESSSADELRKKYGSGTQGKGHHWVPFGSTTDMDLSEDARHVFGESVSGQKIPSQIHCTGHCDYNKAVRGELLDWSRKNRINPANMTAAQARAFVSHIRSGTQTPTIRNFVRKINDFNETVNRFGSGTFVRTLYFLGLYQTAQETISINTSPCVNSPDNTCQR